jgi:hypothetical protein
MVFEGHLKWTRLRHERFGGVTQFQAALGTNIPIHSPLIFSVLFRWNHLVMPPMPSMAPTSMIVGRRHIKVCGCICVLLFQEGLEQVHTSIKICSQSSLGPHLAFSYINLFCAINQVLDLGLFINSCVSGEGH